MSLLNDLRVNVGDDEGTIPSGAFPSGSTPVSFTPSLLADLRTDVGDDEGVIPSGSFISGVLVHGLLSSAHGDTTPGSPAPGHLILGSNPTWTILPSGDEGDALKIIGGSVVWAPDLTSSGSLAAHTGDPDAHHTRYTDAEASGVAVLVVTTGIAEHTAITDAHHSRYTNAEASGIAVLVVTTGIAEHTAISDAHHTRYTDAEASGVAVLVVTTGIAEHAAISDAHHARYTDSEASGVAVLVVTSGIAEHTAISGAHHDRYTDAEAANVAAQVLATGAFDVAVLQESGIELTANATTTSVLPTLSTLLSVPITLIKPSGDLRILATAAVNASAGVPVVFHIYIDGSFHRGTTVNVTGAIDNASIVIPRIAMTGISPHTVELRWAKFNLPFAVVRCLPVALPNFYHASLSVQEIL
jgi:hypothetical protein